MNEAMRLEIVQRRQTGMSQRAIAEELGISRGAVRRALAHVQAQRDGRATPARRPRPRQSIIDPFEPILRELLAKYPNITDQAGLRRQRRIERLIKDANFREALPLSTFDWNFNPAIPRLQIEVLAQADFIRRKQNIVFLGQSGLGKSRLIQSIGLAACMLEQPVHYVTSGKLLEDLTAAMARANSPNPASIIAAGLI